MDDDVVGDECDHLILSSRHHFRLQLDVKCVVPIRQNEREKKKKNIFVSFVSHTRHDHEIPVKSLMSQCQDQWAREKNQHKWNG